MKCGKWNRKAGAKRGAEPLKENTLDSGPHFVLMIDALHPVARIKYHLPGAEVCVRVHVHLALCS